MKIERINGQIVRQVGEDWLPLSVAAYWEYCGGSDISPDGIHLLGISKLGIKVDLRDHLFVQLFVDTEVGVIEIPHTFEFPSDHFVINDFWIPLEEYSSNLIASVFKARKIYNGGKITSPDFLAFLNMANNSGIKVLYRPEILQELEKIEITTKIPSGLSVTPYPYQDLGIRWLMTMFDQGCGSLLCDEMGLGKTLQAIGLMLHASESGAKKILLCTPSSLTLNWLREIKKMAPRLEVHSYVGGSRFLHPNDFNNLEIVQTSYEILVRDYSLFSSCDWDLVICDEAQMLKNHTSKRSNRIQGLRAKTKVLLTGTPVENSLKDLWTLVNIVFPGLMGSKEYFFNQIDDNPIDAARVGQAASPLIKRRRVKDVLPDLPPMIEIDQEIETSKEFSSFYEELRTGRHPRTAGSILLARITALRQFCCYPNLIAEDYPKVQDAKFQRLLELLEEISIAKEKVLIFASFTEPLNLIKRMVDINFDDSWCEIVDGRYQQDKRMEIIDRFQERDGFSVLVLNPEAAGKGLTITAANHVIHFNLPWNPATEAQATARVYRPGQKAEKVFVHRFFYSRTIEEVINQRLIFKEEIADAAMEAPESESNSEFVKNALTISPIG
jgi:SNF2 family DNA or RNA helicase